MTEKGRILIIAPEIVPRVNSWGGSQRMYYLANMLEEWGANVTTLAPGFADAVACKNKKILYRSIYLGEVFGERKESGHKKHLAEERKNKKLILKKIKRIIYSILVTMDYFVYSEPSSFQGRFYKKWLKEHDREIKECIDTNKIEKIIISGPSFALFSIAKKIKKNDADIRIIFDYRDPWYLWKKQKNLAYLKEKKFLKYADCVVCFSEAFRNDMCKIFKISMDKAKVVCNGYSEETWEKVEMDWEGKVREDGRLVITYVGSMDFNDNKKNYRNPNAIMKAVERLPEGVVELRFVGVSSMEEMKVRNNISYVGKVTQEESFGYMLESDVLLNIHDTHDDSGEYLVPGKFYDYMRSGKVIWNIGKENSLATKMLKEYKLGVSCENNRNNLEDMIDQLIALKKKGEINRLRWDDRESVLFFSREIQNKMYMEILKDL